MLQPPQENLERCKRLYAFPRSTCGLGMRLHWSLKKKAVMVSKCHQNLNKVFSMRSLQCIFWKFQKSLMLFSLYKYIASYPGSSREEKKEPGINCMRICLISPDYGYYFCILSVYLNLNPGTCSAELQGPHNNKGFSANEWAVFVLQ